MKRIYVVLLILVFLILVGFYLFQWRERSLQEMEEYASEELEFTYGRILSSQFMGPTVVGSDSNSVEFYWFKVDGCDTTKVFISVPKRGTSDPKVSSITNGCK